MTVMDLDKPGAQPPSPGPKLVDKKCDDLFVTPAFDSEALLGRVLAGKFYFFIKKKEELGQLRPCFEISSLHSLALAFLQQC